MPFIKFNKKASEYPGERETIKLASFKRNIGVSKNSGVSPPNHPICS